MYFFPAYTLTSTDLSTCHVLARVTGPSLSATSPWNCQPHVLSPCRLQPSEFFLSSPLKPGPAGLGTGETTYSLLMPPRRHFSKPPLQPLETRSASQAHQRPHQGFEARVESLSFLCFFFLSCFKPHLLCLNITYMKLDLIQPKLPISICAILASPTATPKAHPAY